ncbi:translocation/assembly module TamB domain-containing protein [Shewanella algae]|uniref:translocation/assembly module TamB domain-containing protein n=1 Tax=Shewanella algae TaxID=38313 RepID=UPI001AAE86BE|nr:translocation/assembly module TamB domain-containing protein [Shewanella algae]MBO2662348.1 translocation/assembly module TamB domain-containing protein [Shewanella algae]MCL1052276.1 translocation/assembly module TamB domain-containing protein [Shewanella algae]
MSQAPMPQEPNPSSKQVAKKTRPLWLKSLRWFTRTLLYIPLGLLVLLALLLGTAPGSHLAVFLASALVPDLELEYASGTLNRELQLKQVHWQMDGISVAADAVTLAWQPACLLQKQLCVDALELTTTQVDIDTQALASDSATEEEAPSSGELVLPFGISLKRASLTDIQVRVDEMHFDAAALNTAANWQESGLQIIQLESRGLSVLIPEANAAEAQATDKDKSAAVAKQQKAAPKSETDEWALAQMPNVAMPFPIYLKHAELKDSRLQIMGRDDRFEELRLSASYIGAKLRVNEFYAKHTDASLSLEGELTLDKHWPMALTVQLELQRLPELPGLEQQLLDLALKGDFSDLQLKAKLSGEQSLALNASVNLANPELPYSVNISEGELHWPFDLAQYSVSGLALESRGSLKQQAASVVAQISTPFYPELSLNTRLAHQGQRLKIEEFSSDSSAGKLVLQGTLDYADGIAWDANLALSHFNSGAITLPSTEEAAKEKDPNSQVAHNKRKSDNEATSAQSQADEGKSEESLAEDTPVIPSSDISGQLASSGRWQDSKWRVSLKQTQLQGSLDRLPFELTGDLDIDDSLELSSQGLSLRALNTRLDLSGSAKEQWDLSATLDVPDFNLWHPEAFGALTADIQVVGDAKHPQVQLKANTQSIRFGDLKLSGSQLKALYAPLDLHEFALSLKTSEFDGAGIHLDGITLRAKGNEQQQKLGLETEGDLQLDTAIHSKLDLAKQKAKVELSKFNLGSVLGLWQLEQTVSLNWDLKQNRGELSGFCLSHPSSRLCLTDNVSLSDKGEAKLHYQGQPGQLLAKLLPEQFSWQGDALMDAAIAWKPGARPQGKLDFQLAPGKVSLKRKQQASASVDYQALKLNATLDDDALRSHILFNSDALARWESQLDIKVTPDRSLSGYVNIEKINLQLLGQFMPQLETIEGLLGANLKLAGSLNNPELSGQLNLHDGALASTVNPTRLEQISLDMAFAGQTAELQGQWMMGSGQANLSGQLRWPEGQFSGDIQLKGQELGVIQPPLAIVNVSPDIQLHFSPDALDIKGEVKVPSGNIKVVQLPAGGVSVSSDVVFSDSISEQETKASSMALSADLNIDVGDKLAIDGMGLKGMLVGTLRMQQSPQKPPQLFGDIKVVNGSYKFMGQTLKIATGAVQFVGPMQIPNLNIEAIREIRDEDVTAGVRITGTPNKPIVTLFSNPAKEQAEILSYIVQGKGFGSGNEQNNSLMMGAALSLSSQVDGGAISSLGDTAAGLVEMFGFSNVQLDTNDDGKVAISGYIGKDLMIKYGVGVFNPGYEMTVRYYLLSQLYLESVSGTLGQSLDIYYSFDL